MRNIINKILKFIYENFGELFTVNVVCCCYIFTMYMNDRRTRIQSMKRNKYELLMKAEKGDIWEKLFTTITLMQVKSYLMSVCRSWIIYEKRVIQANWLWQWEGPVCECCWEKYLKWSRFLIDSAECIKDLLKVSVSKLGFDANLIGW